MDLLLNGNDHFVYLLIDENWVELYVGVTNDPVQRLRAHKSQPCENLRELMEQGYVPVMRVVGHFRTREAALREEGHLIKLLQPLLNTRGVPEVDKDEDMGDMVRRIINVTRCVKWL